jgi:hypothetical protein
VATQNGEASLAALSSVGTRSTSARSTSTSAAASGRRGAQDYVRQAVDSFPGVVRYLEPRRGYDARLPADLAMPRAAD